ncbi:MAG: LamG domain-containing protein [Candidatus Binatia bacterium]
MQAENLLADWVLRPEFGDRAFNLADPTISDGTFTNFASPVPWQSDIETIHGLDFDGTDDFINFGAGHLFTPQDWTLCATVRLGASAAFRTIFGMGDQVTAGGKSGMFLRVRNSDTPEGFCYVGTDVEGGVIGGTVLSEDQEFIWLALRKDGTSLKLFLNGIEEGSATLSSAAMDYSSNDPTTRIGTISTGQFPWLGLIANVRLYDAPLSDAVILQMWHPATRWELYRPLRIVGLFEKAVAGAAGPFAQAQLGVGL